MKLYKFVDIQDYPLSLSLVLQEMRPFLPLVSLPPLEELCPSNRGKLLVFSNRNQDFDSNLMGEKYFDGTGVDD
jgi:hypothetical protein